MTTDPTIIDADRAAARGVYNAVMGENMRVVTVEYLAAQFARHREQQKQNALDDFLEDLTEAFGVEWNENPETGLRPTAFSASEALEYAKHLCELEQREKTIGRVKHCDRCGSDWADNGINSGCPCVLLAEHQKREKRLEQRAVELELNLRVAKQAVNPGTGVWMWQGDGEDCPESLTCPVLARPEQMLVLTHRITELEQREKVLVEALRWIEKENPHGYAPGSYIVFITAIQNKASKALKEIA